LNRKISREFVDKPKVTVVLSIYRPNLKWLRELLVSLNGQDYKNLDLLIWNDCPEDKNNYEKIFSEYITEFPFCFVRGTKNLQTSAAFSFLAEQATGDYIAFCDQDDIWYSDKISSSIDYLVSRNKEVLFGNMDIMDSDGNVSGDTFLKDLDSYVNASDNDILTMCLYRPHAYGCTMLVKRTLIQKYVPFPVAVSYHDIWVAIVGAANSQLCVFNKSLLRYRLHGNNQSAFATTTSTKAGYVTSLKNRRLLGKAIFDKVRDLEDVDKREIIIKYFDYVDALYLYHVAFSFKRLRTILVSSHGMLRSKIAAIVWPVLPENGWKFLICIAKVILRKG